VKIYFGPICQRANLLGATFLASLVVSGGGPEACDLDDLGLKLVTSNFGLFVNSTERNKKYMADQ